MRGSFEPISEWWNRKIGDAGDPYNQHLIMPALLETLGDVSGLSVLDIGAGNGMCSRTLARGGARVTGVEVSPTLVKHARQHEERENLGITYVVGDAADLSLFSSETFDRVVANMVLMDAEDAEGIIREASRVLVPGGLFVASLLHPCFEAPGGSDWADVDASEDEPFIRRVWRYRHPFTCADKLSNDQPGEIQRFHRPLSWYASSLRRAGLLIYALNEPTGTERFAELKPRGYRRQQVVPAFLVIGAVKADTPGVHTG